VSSGEESPNGEPDQTFKDPDALLNVVHAAVTLLREQFSGEQFGKAA